VHIKREGSSMGSFARIILTLLVFGFLPTTHAGIIESKSLGDISLYEHSYEFNEDKCEKSWKLHSYQGVMKTEGYVRICYVPIGIKLKNTYFADEMRVKKQYDNYHFNLVAGFEGARLSVYEIGKKDPMAWVDMKPYIERFLTEINGEIKVKFIAASSTAKKVSKVVAVEREYDLAQADFAKCEKEWITNGGLFYPEGQCTLMDLSEYEGEVSYLQEGFARKVLIDGKEYRFSLYPNEGSIGLRVRPPHRGLNLGYKRLEPYIMAFMELQKQSGQAIRTKDIVAADFNKNKLGQKILGELEAFDQTYQFMGDECAQNWKGTLYTDNSGGSGYCHIDVVKGPKAILALGSVFAEAEDIFPDGSYYYGFYWFETKKGVDSARFHIDVMDKYFSSFEFSDADPFFFEMMKKLNHGLIKRQVIAIK
jgi:hypothetical protein